MDQYNLKKERKKNLLFSSGICNRRVHSVGSNVANLIRFALFVGSDFFDSIGRIDECRIFDIRSALLRMSDILQGMPIKKISISFPRYSTEGVEISQEHLVHFKHT